ncbi:hypothetical protein D3C71_1189600 [compost metagenome]
MANAHFRKHFGDAFVDIPVAARFPGGVDGCRERVNKRMHIRGIHIVFLVPGCGRQDDIREQTGAGHTEIKRHQQVELAFDGGGLPLHFFRFDVVRRAKIVALNTVFRSEQVFEHVLMAFPGGAEQVRAPDEEITRVVFAVVGLFAGEAQIARFQRLNRVLLRGHSGGISAGFDVQRVERQLWGGRQPAHAFGTHIKVDQMAGEFRRIRQRGEQLLRGEFLVAPLAGVVVEERGAVHLARRAVPVEGKRQR